MTKHQTQDHGTKSCERGYASKAPTSDRWAADPFNQTPRVLRERAATRIMFDGIVASISDLCAEVSDELVELVISQQADEAADAGTGIIPSIDDEGRRVWLQDHLEDPCVDDLDEDDDHSWCLILAPEDIGLPHRQRGRTGYSPSVDFEPDDDVTPYALDGFTIRSRP
jgi:hypothetical protein